MLVLSKLKDLNTQVETKNKKPKITVENIAEFYPTMSEGEKEKYFDILSTLFHERGKLLDKAIPNNEPFGKLNKNWHVVIGQVVGQTIFGIKDNLQPMDQYIEQIRNRIS